MSTFLWYSYYHNKCLKLQIHAYLINTMISWTHTRPNVGVKWIIDACPIPVVQFQASVQMHQNPGILISEIIIAVNIGPNTVQISVYNSTLSFPNPQIPKWVHNKPFCFFFFLVFWIFKNPNNFDLYLKKILPTPSSSSSISLIMFLHHQPVTQLISSIYSSFPSLDVGFVLGLPVPDLNHLMAEKIMSPNWYFPFLL